MLFKWASLFFIIWGATTFADCPEHIELADVKASLLAQAYLYLNITDGASMRLKMMFLSYTYNLDQIWITAMTY